MGPAWRLEASDLSSRDPELSSGRDPRESLVVQLSLQAHMGKLRLTTESSQPRREVGAVTPPPPPCTRGNGGSERLKGHEVGKGLSRDLNLDLAPSHKAGQPPQLKDGRGDTSPC